MALQAHAESISSISGFFAQQESAKENKVPERDVSQELFVEIQKAAKVLKEKMPRGLSLTQSMNGLMVDSLLTLHRDVKTKKRPPEDHTMQAKGVHRFFEEFYGRDNWPIVRSGLLGEVATGIILEEIGFKTAEATQKDDLIGKIDIWAIDEGGNMVIPIQCKTSSLLKTPELYRIDSEKEHFGVPNGYGQIAIEMIRYLSEIGEEDRLKGKEVVPLIIELPGGEGNIDTSYHMYTGRPSKQAVTKITDLFYKEVWND